MIIFWALIYQAENFTPFYTVYIAICFITVFRCAVLHHRYGYSLHCTVRNEKLWWPRGPEFREYKGEIDCLFHDCIKQEYVLDTRWFFAILQDNLIPFCTH